MDECIILPFDGSPPARMALRRAVEAAQAGGGLYSHIVVATAGVERTVVVRLLQEAQQRGGPVTPFEVRFLDPVDPIGAWYDLLGSLPEATVAAPIGVRGAAPWYAQACRPGALPHKMMLFFLHDRDVQQPAGAIRQNGGASMERGGVWLVRVWRWLAGHRVAAAPEGRRGSGPAAPVVGVRGGDRVP